MKKDNKGFSLVELIIVIAIMAVLVGLLAPQYLKYVNNSKVSTDISNAQEIATAVNVAFADDQYSAGTTAVTSMPDSSSFPTSKLDSSYNWVVTLGDNGVSKITLNGFEIYPEPKKGTKDGGAASTGYYTQYHK